MRTILLVEDSPIVREPLARLLRVSGFQVIVAADGAQAIEHLRSASIDLVLFDIMMPRMDGVRLMERIAVHQPRIPVICVTASMSSLQLTRLRELGVTSILSKMRFDFDDLLREIQTHLLQASSRAVV